MERPELAIQPTLIEVPHTQEVNYFAGKEAPSSVLINYLWHLNYSEYGSPSPLANLQMFCIRAVSWGGREWEEKNRSKGRWKEIVEG